MTSLVMRDGKLLLVGGALTSNESCCCEQDDCPACCVKINFGEFDGDGNLVETYDLGEGVTIDVKVTVPTANSRIVCDEDQITVQWDYLNAGDPDATAAGGYARFGAAWSIEGVSPAIVAPGGQDDWGLADWGPASEEESHSVTLRFRKCFLDASPFLAYVTIGFDIPDWSLDIDITGCPLPDWCCREDPVCEPCCAVLNLNGWVEYDGKLHYISDSADVDGNRYTIIGIISTEAIGKVCLDGGLILEMYLVPPRIDDEPNNNMVVEFGTPWQVEDISPAIAGDGEQTAVKVDWGTLTDQYYRINLSIECDANCTEEPVDGVIPDIGAVNDVFGVVVVDFDDCDMTDCCCPTWCVCGCEWPFSQGFCDNALEDDLFGLYEAGGGTQLIDLEVVITASANVFCSASTNTVTLAQNGDSWHLATCVNGCPRTNGLLVPMSDGSQNCGGATPTAGRARLQLDPDNSCVPGVNLTIDFAMEGGIPFSAERIPIDSGGLTGCNTLNASGSKVMDGVTYSWVITGEIVNGRECPCE